MATNRELAKRKTRGWQVAAIALVGAAVALLALPVGKLLGPRKPQAIKQEALDTPKPPDTGGIDTDRFGRIIAGLGGRAPAQLREPPIETTTIAGPGGPIETTPPPPPNSLAFVGLTGLSSNPRAILKAGDTQFALGSGQERDGVRLVSVAADHVTITRDGVEERIERGERKSIWPTNAPISPVVMRQPGQGIPGQPGANISSNKGMDARQQAAAEQMAKYKNAMNPGVRPPMATQFSQIEPEKRDAMLSEIANPDISPEHRRALMTELGIPANLPPKDQIEMLRNAGAEFEPDEKLMEMLKNE